MATIHSSYSDHLRVQATHLASNTILITDAPVDNHGKGASFSPTDLACTALAHCAMTIMGIVAQQSGISLSGSHFETTKIMSGSLPRRIASVEIAFSLPAGISVENQKILEKAAANCPVALSLHPDIIQKLTFNYSV